jgi:hypothetical protein
VVNAFLKPWTYVISELLTTLAVVMLVLLLMMMTTTATLGLSTKIASCEDDDVGVDDGKYGREDDDDDDDDDDDGDDDDDDDDTTTGPTKHKQDFRMNEFQTNCQQQRITKSMAERIRGCRM